MLKAALEFEIVDLPEETFAFVVRRVAPTEVGEFIHGALARVAEFAAVRGGPQGPPMAITTAPDEYGSLVVEAGLAGRRRRRTCRAGRGADPGRDARAPPPARRPVRGARRRALRRALSQLRTSTA